PILRGRMGIPQQDQMQANTVEVSVLEEAGAICVSAANGTRICSVVHSLLGMGANVVINFNGVEVLTPSFLNTAVSCLYDGSFTLDELAARVRFVSLGDNEALLNLVIENAKRFYAASVENKKQMIEATQRQVAICQ